MKHPKKGVLDTVIYNTDITVTNIPNKVYNYIVNGKPAIEWIIDQYNVSIDKKSGILDDPNEFSEDPNYILNLLLSVITVSMKTLGLIDKLPDFEILD
ncbi:TPA: helicase [Staphylococcus aureus]|nr:helicase [Staphylococcus aureus]